MPAAGAAGGGGGRPASEDVADHREEEEDPGGDPGGSGSGRERDEEVELDEALEAYAAAQHREWDTSATSRRMLLRVCAEHGRVEVALDVLRDMQVVGVEPGFDALDALMRACRERGDIDPETLQMWLGKEQTEVVMDRRGGDSGDDASRRARQLQRAGSLAGGKHGRRAAPPARH